MNAREQGRSSRSRAVRPLGAILLALAFGSGCDRDTTTASTTPPATQSSNATPAQTLTVAAAADLQFAADDLRAGFHSLHPEIDLQFTFGSSGVFYSQLANKAPFDVFLSADTGYPEKLAGQNLIVPGSLFHYAVGKIVIWAPADSKLDVSKQGFDVLLDPAVKKIAVANPQHAPYGRAAEAALKKRHLWEKLQSKIVLGENISQTAQFVSSGSADVGIIALSLASSPQMNDGKSFVVPTEDYPPIRQAGVILSWTTRRDAAEAFRAFLTGPEGRGVLERYGFAAPEK